MGKRRYFALSLRLGRFYPTSGSEFTAIIGTKYFSNLVPQVLKLTRKTLYICNGIISYTVKFTEAFNYRSLPSTRYRFLSVDIDPNVTVVSISVFSLQNEKLGCKLRQGILNKSSSSSCRPI